MPNRTTLNKYELFITEIRRLAKKKELSNTESVLKLKAMMIAALTSNHSWRTYKYFRNGESFDNISVLSETKNAFTDGWRNITESDIGELVIQNFDPHKLSVWLHSVFETEEERNQYRLLLNNMKSEFIDGLEPIEKMTD